MDYGLMEQDPYYIYKGQLESSLGRLETVYDTWKDRLENTDTSLPEFLHLHKELNSSLKNTNKSLKLMETTVQKINDDPSKFSITPSELSTRNSDLQRLTQLFKNMATNYKSKEVSEKMERDKRRASEKKGSLTGFKATRAAAERENSEFITNARQEQEMIVRNQDQMLGELGNVVDHLDAVGRSIGDEINQQEKLIVNLDEDMEHTQGQFGTVMGKLQKLLKAKNNCQIYSICGLALVVLILAILLIFL